MQRLSINAKTQKQRHTGKNNRIFTQLLQLRHDYNSILTAFLQKKSPSQGKDFRKKSIYADCT